MNDLPVIHCDCSSRNLLDMPYIDQKAPADLQKRLRSFCLLSHRAETLLKLQRTVFCDQIAVFLLSFEIKNRIFSQRHDISIPHREQILPVLCIQSPEEDLFHRRSD